MRISDWSSDVCASDLGAVLDDGLPAGLVDRNVEESCDAPDFGRHVRLQVGKVQQQHVGQIADRPPRPDVFPERPEREAVARQPVEEILRSEEHTSELQSLLRTSYAVFCLKNNKKHKTYITIHTHNHEQQ